MRQTSLIRLAPKQSQLFWDVNTLLLWNTHTFAVFMICLEAVSHLADLFTEKMLLLGKLIETYSCNWKHHQEKTFSLLNKRMNAWLKVFSRSSKLHYFLLRKSFCIKPCVFLLWCFKKTVLLSSGVTSFAFLYFPYISFS